MRQRFHRQIIIIGLVSLFTDIASEMLYPIAPLYMSNSLGAGMAVIGLLEGVAEGLASLFKGYFGALSDAMGKRALFIRWGYAISALSKPLPGIWTSLAGVITSRLSDRMGKAVRTAARDALLSSYATAGTRGSVFGFHRAMDTLGAALGPILALGYLWLQPGNYTTLFLLAAIPGLAAVAITWVVRDPTPSEREVRKGSSPFNRLASAWKDSPSETRRLLAAVFLFTLVNSSDVFIILKARSDLGSDLGAISVYILYNVVYALVAWPCGILADRFGTRRIYLLGMLVYATAYLLFAFPVHSIMLWVGAVIYGIYAASTESVAKAWLANLTPAHSRGAVFGLLTAGTSLGALLASVGAGLLWTSLGSSWPFLLAALGALASMAIVPSGSGSIGTRKKQPDEAGSELT